MSSISQGATGMTVDHVETLRVWCIKHQASPMMEVWDKSLQDLVLAAVPLQKPGYRRVAEDQTVHPDGAILVDLAVRSGYVPYVISKYGPIDFIPLHDSDPVILAQEGDNIKEKIIAGYDDVYSRYVAGYANCEDNEVVKAWFNSRCHELRSQMQDMQPRLETMRIWCTEHQEDPMNGIVENGLADVVLDAVALEDPCPGRAILVDLAMDPQGTERVQKQYHVISLEDTKYWLSAFHTMEPRYREAYDRHSGSAEGIRKWALDDWYAEWFENWSAYMEGSGFV